MNEEEKKMPSAEVKPHAAKKDHKNNGPIVGIIIAVIVVIILAPILVFGIGLYKFNWNDKYTVKIASIIPYPAAVVNNHIVKYIDWKEDIDTINHFYDKEEEYGMLAAGSRPTQEQIEQDELDRLIQKQVMLDEAKKRGITVTQEEVDKKFDEEILPQTQGGIDEVSATLDDLYGWTVDDFKKNVIEEMIYREKLAEQVNDELDSIAKTKADEVLQKALSGEDFSQLAAQYGEDGTAATGGDLGTFSQGDMVAEFDEAIFNQAPTGEVYNQLVKTQYGYHIIKVEEIKDGEDGKKQATAKHILISTNLDKYLDQLVDNEKIYKFVAKN